MLAAGRPASASAPRPDRYAPLSVHAQPTQLQIARAALRGHRVGAVIARTATFNVAGAVTAALGGVILARALGPTARGEYAAVTAWFGVLLMVGEMGQGAAVCFHVARDPDNAREYVATSRTMMLVTGGVAVAGGLLLAPVLAHGHPGLADAYRIAFAGAAISFTSTSYTYSLQARSIGAVEPGPPQPAGARPGGRHRAVAAAAAQPRTPPCTRWS